jgi:hypothetical protein
MFGISKSDPQTHVERPCAMARHGLAQSRHLACAVTEIEVPITTLQCVRPCAGQARTSRRVPLAGLRCAVSPGPRLRLFRPVSRPCVGLGFLVRPNFALHSLAVWCVCAIAPSFIFGWRALSSVFLCKCNGRI